MRTIVAFLLLVLLLAGVIRIVMFLRSKSPIWIELSWPLGIQSLLILGFWNISFAGIGLYLLVNGTNPLDILVGGSLVVPVFEVAFRKGSMSPW